MRSIFCGNFEYDARQTELERLFKRYGRVERVDMKAGLSWVIYTLPGLWMAVQNCTFPVTSIFLFSRRITLIRNGRTMPIFLRLLPFISHDFCPAFNPRHVSILKHCRPHSRGSRIDGEGSLFSLTHHETSTFGF